MTKVETQVSVSNGDDEMKGKSFEKLRNLWLGYYFSISYYKKLITPKTLKKIWPFPIYSKSELIHVHNILKDSLLNKDFFIYILNDLKKKPWLDLYLEAVKIYPDYFRNCFNKNKDKYSKFIEHYMVQVMKFKKDASETAFLTYTDEDVSPISEDLYVISNFWVARNFYKAISIVNPSWGNEIYRNAVNIYSQYLEDLELINISNQDIGAVFTKVKTLYAKIDVLMKIWEKAKVVEDKIDYRPLLTIFKEDILKILEEVLLIGEEDLIDEVSAIVTALHSTYSISDINDLEDFKKRSLELYEKYHHIPVVNQILKKIKKP